MIERVDRKARDSAQQRVIPGGSRGALHRSDADRHGVSAPVAFHDADVVAQAGERPALGRRPPVRLQEPGGDPGSSAWPRSRSRSCAQASGVAASSRQTSDNSRVRSRGVARLTGRSWSPAREAKRSRRQPCSAVARRSSGASGSRSAGSPPSASKRASAAATSDTVSARAARSRNEISIGSVSIANPGEPGVRSAPSRTRCWRSRPASAARNIASTRWTLKTDESTSGASAPIATSRVGSSMSTT